MEEEAMPKPVSFSYGVSFGLVALIAFSGAAVLSASVAAGDLPGHGRVVTAADDSLIEGRFQTEIVFVGLERLGYQPGEVLNLNVPTMYVALAQEEADFLAVGWQPQNTETYEKAGGDDKMTQVGVIVKGAAQGYQIDKRTAEEFGITDITQLKAPELAKLFDTDGDGRANLAGCPPGWGCETVIEHHLDSYGLRDWIQHDQGDFVPIHADVVARYKTGERVLFYTYVPMWLSQILVPGVDVEWLEVPFTSLPYDPGEREFTTELADGRNLGFEVQVIKIVACNKFLEENPAARRFFELVEIPLEDVNAENLLIYQGEDTLDDVRRHAEEWISRHQAMFDAWVADAMAAAE
jgi:glycine betaine/proline transport system substrate-binding protein